MRELERSEWDFGPEALLGVVSDTHRSSAAPDPPRALLDRLQGVDLILHAGDVCHPAVLEALAEIAPVEAVLGNMDGALLAGRLPQRRLIRVGRRLLGLAHGWGAPARTPDLVWEDLTALLEPEERLDALIFGHSHHALCTWREGVLLLNPGSPAKPLDGRRSLALLHCGDRLHAEVVYL